MSHGRIKKLVAEKGYGFIAETSGDDYFFHRNQLIGLDFKALKVDDPVVFDLRPSRNKPGTDEAYRVRADSTLAPSPPNAIAQRPPIAAARQQTLYPPYRFIPVPEKIVAAAPVWHDGTHVDEPTYSGELRCSLKALTPLLAANQRYPLSAANKRTFEEWLGTTLSDDKKVAEPLRLKDGRIALAGTGLKGMLRHSLAALLGAPMERVGEHHFTYRPNLDFSHAEKRVDVRPAFLAPDDNTLEGPSMLWILAGARDAIFIREDAWPEIERSIDAHGLLPKGISVSGVAPPNKNRIDVGLGWKPEENYVLLSYKGGIDGEGLFGESHNPPTRTYHHVVVRESAVNHAIALDLDHEVLKAYKQTYKQTQTVLANVQTGHLSNHPNIVGTTRDACRRAIERNTEIEDWQLIYVELTLDKNGLVSAASKVLSMGHHFRYRWAYSSTIRRWNGTELRTCLSPTPEEQAPVPTALTGVRSLFGYVSSDDKDTGIGKGKHQRLAGRIAINHAVSIGTPIFVGSESQGYCIPLPLQGQPKPSAWEFYLQQHGGSKLPATYGDVPGDRGGDLAGRKFYLHQPAIRAASDLIAATAGEPNATLARFVCAPDTEFRFTIRFTRLRTWELAALLATIEPGFLEASSDRAKAPTYAHKLGMGRPLGMGSVALKVDSAWRRSDQETRLKEVDPKDLFGEGAEKLEKAIDPSTRARWLAIHRFIDRGLLGYPLPSGPKKRGECNIFDWHTDLRRRYSKARRERSPNYSEINADILPAHKLS